MLRNIVSNREALEREKAELCLRMAILWWLFEFSYLRTCHIRGSQDVRITYEDFYDTSKDCYIPMKRDSEDAFLEIFMDEDVRYANSQGLFESH